MTTPSYQAGPGRSLAAAAPYIPPFSVQGSCVLSEDYFLTEKVVMNAADVVRPFVRADGTVEALILSGGVVSHLSRSAAATSGWTCAPLPAPADVPQAEPVDVATVTAPDGTVWALVLRIYQGATNVIAPFATQELAESTEGASEIIKMFVDYLGNLGAAGCMGAALEA